MFLPKQKQLMGRSYSPIAIEGARVEYHKSHRIESHLWTARQADCNPRCRSAEATIFLGLLNWRVD